MSVMLIPKNLKLLATPPHLRCICLLFLKSTIGAFGLIDVEQKVLVLENNLLCELRCLLVSSGAQATS